MIRARQVRVRGTNEVLEITGTVMEDETEVIFVAAPALTNVVASLSRESTLSGVSTSAPALAYPEGRSE